VIFSGSRERKKSRKERDFLTWKSKEKNDGSTKSIQKEEFEKGMTHGKNVGTNAHGMFFEGH